MKTFYVILAGVFVIWGYFSCLATKTYNSPQARSAEQIMTVVDEDAADGLDLKTLFPILKDVANAEELEKKINEPGGVNNLDLNNDGEVDYIKVTEFGNKDSYGFSLTTEPEKGQEQEVATIQIQRSEEKADVQVTGNPQLYGANHHYHHGFGLTNWLLLAYLMRPHSYYVSPWYYNHYPTYYRPYRSVSRSNYFSRTKTKYASRPAYGSVRKTSSPTINTGLRSPNADKVATSGIRKSLKSPTQAQKQFRARAQAKAVKSGGFGRSSSANNSRRSAGSVRSSSSSRGFSGRGK